LLVDPLEGVRLKLERAEHVIDELNQAVIAYLAEQPYEVVGKFERESSEYVLRGKVTKATAYLGVIAGDVVHNLRSSLDHLAWQLALLNTATPYARTQFPIALSPGEFNSRTGQNMIRDLSAKHQVVIEAFQPYNGGDPADDSASLAPFALRDLRTLSNTDKHRVLNATAARQTFQDQATIRPVIVRDATGYSNLKPFSGGSIDGAELARMTLEGVGPHPEVKMQGGMTVTISFDDPALTVHQQSGVIPLLRAIVKGVREVVAAFEPDL
jgi:hypothetical protein